MDIIEMQLRISQTVLRYQLVFHPVRQFAPTIIFEDDDVVVKTILMSHRIPCTGFLFKETLTFKDQLKERLGLHVQEYSATAEEIENIRRRLNSPDNSRGDCCDQV
jgi:ribonuclease Z